MEVVAVDDHGASAVQNPRALRVQVTQGDADGAGDVLRLVLLLRKHLDELRRSIGEHSSHLAAVDELGHLLDRVRAASLDGPPARGGSIKCLIDGRMRPSTQTREDRRTALVTAAYRQIAQHGFEGLRTRDVAAEVGVNIATLHYYFPTKEKLIQGVVAHAMGRFRTTLEGGVGSGDMLRKYLRGVRRLLAEEPELGAVMGELALRSSRDPALAPVLQEMNETWHKTVRGLLHRAAKEGQISRELDADPVAALIVAVLASMSLPRADARNSQALQQLERWLGSTAGPTHSSN